MKIINGVRLPKEAKLYWLKQLGDFADNFDNSKISEVQFGKQDIRGTESICLIDKKSCVPKQKHFENKWAMLGYIQGYNEAEYRHFEGLSYWGEYLK